MRNQGLKDIEDTGGGGDVKNKRKKIIVKDPCRKERIFFFKEGMIGF